MNTIQQLRRILDEDFHLAEDKLAMHAKKLHDLEDTNDHSGYVVYLAKLSRDSKLLKAAKAVVVLHTVIGSMPHDLYQVRYGIMQAAESKLRVKMGADYDRMMGMT